MITCKKAVDLVLDFLEENMSPELRQGLMKHFDDCPPCLEFVRSYKSTANLCRETLLKNAPPEFTDRLMSFLREETGRNKKLR